jgi:hypothetical protein
MPTLSERPVPLAQSERLLSERESKEEELLRELVDDTYRTSLIAGFVRKQRRLLASISSYSALCENWDSYGAQPPSGPTLNRALDFLSRLYVEMYLPSSVEPSAEGGIAFYFAHENKRAYVEFRNIGETILAMYDRDSDPIVTDLTNTPDDDQRAIRLIRGYLS